MEERQIQAIIRSRRELLALTPPARRSDEAAEGGCGVLGLAANIPIAGHHVLTASMQMHNRGNGKGGGIAMVGLDPTQAGVDTQTLQTHFLLQIAFLDPTAREEVEREFIIPYFDIAAAYELPHLDDHRAVEGDQHAVRPVTGHIGIETLVAQRRGVAGDPGVDHAPGHMGVGGLQPACQPGRPCVGLVPRRAGSDRIAQGNDDDLGVVGRRRGQHTIAITDA